YVLVCGLTSDQNRLRHGEAVAIGMALDCTYAYLIGMLSKSAWEQIIATLKQLGFTLYAPELAVNLSSNEVKTTIFAGLDEFREHLGGELAIMLLKELGKGVEVGGVRIAIYRKAILMLQEIEAK
ncbi:MAG: hypothetical protein AAFR77_21905, partial [Cyanobacteria bacterium J06631_2]